MGLVHNIASLRPEKFQRLSRIMGDATLWILMRPALEFRRIAQLLSFSRHARVFLPEIAGGAGRLRVHGVHGATPVTVVLVTWHWCQHV